MTGLSQPTQRRGASDAANSRTPIYTEKFAADPHSCYREMRRRFGSLVPVDLAPGVPATLIVNYRTAMRILDDPTHFPSDARVWQQQMPPGLPIVALMQWQPSPLRSHGAGHTRYRSVTVDALSGIDLNSLRTHTSRTAVALINGFCADGHAELIDQYLAPLILRVMDEILGCPTDIGDQLMNSITEVFDPGNDARIDVPVDAAFEELIARKRAEPGHDLASRLVRHPAQLSDTELVHQLMGLYRAGLEPLRNLISSTLLLILTDPRFTTNQVGFARSIREALDEVLATDPPLANHCITYPPLPILVEDVWLPADQPVVISLAACSNDPDRGAGRLPGEEKNLVWGAGLHACPAYTRAMSGLIAEAAIDQLLDALPDLCFAPDPEVDFWRPGPFQRALTALSVEFSPSPRIRMF